MFSQILATLALAVFLDLAFGEPPEKIHPTVLMGKITGFLMRARGTSMLFGGAMLAFVALGSALLAYLLLDLFEGVLALIVGAVVLKTTFSWKALRKHVRSVAGYVEKGDIAAARRATSDIVGRDTQELDEKHLLSAAVESTSESLPDGIISPLFYYLLLAPFGLDIAVAAAVFFRAVSTLDSMVGYEKYSGLGYLPAKVDDALNFLPARLSSLLITASAFLLGESWKGALEITWRDRRKTPSPNSGYPMSAVAGALSIKLEKHGHYTLGNEKEEIAPEHIYRTLKLIYLSTFLFLTSGGTLYILSAYI